MKPNKMLRLIFFSIVVLIILWNIGVIVLDEFYKVSNSIQENYSTQRTYSEKRTISKRATKVVTLSAMEIKVVEPYIGGTNWINFRNAPNLQSKVKEVLKRGTKLEIISKEKNWSKVELESGKKGYVYNKYITKNKEEFVVGEKNIFAE